MNKIDLTRFSQEKEAVVPIVNMIGKVNGRKFISEVEDGWYKIRVGDIIHDVEKATPFQIEKALEGFKLYSGYPMGGDIVPINFDNLFRKGFGETVPVHFLNEAPWEIVGFSQWEDGLFYSRGPNIKANRTVIREVQKAFEEERNLEGIKGITPEIRYYYLLHSLNRDAFRAAEELKALKLAEAEKQKRIEEFRKTFAGRLQQTIENAGGKLIRYYQRGSNYTVVWKVKGQQITSTIRNDDSIIDLGFCASGYDQEHTLSSAIKLAQTYYEEGGVGHGGLYITRG